MSEQYKRKCANWLDDFMKWTLPRSESPETIIYWCGLFTLAAAIRRKVGVTREYLGSWDCYPSIYVMFIGPAGSIKKSTTIGYAEQLLDEVFTTCNLTKAPAGVTVPDLIQRLAQADDSSCYIINSEFSTLIQKAGPAMYEILTDLYDGRKNIDEGTISRGHVFVESPVVNMIAATTPKWIAGNMTEDQIGGGFGSRIIPIHESKVRQRRMYYKHVMKSTDFPILEKRLVEDLEHIGKDISGNFEIADDAYEFMENWYQRNAETPTGSDPKLTGYYNRRPAHIHKVAMLRHIAYSDSLVLTLDDFKGAIKDLETIEGKVSDTFRAVGKNTYIASMDDIAAFVKERGRVERSILFKQFESAAEPTKLEELVNGLIAIGDIQFEMDSSDRKMYFIPG